MAMNMDAILNVRANVDGANKIVELNRGLKTMEGTAKGLTGAMRGLTGASAGLSGALGALAPLLSVAGLVGLAKGALDAGDKMNDLSQSTGVSVEALARFKKAAATSGTDIDSVAKAMGKLSKNMLDAATGSKQAAAPFKALGISVTDSKGKLKTADAVLLQIADRFKEMGKDPAKPGLAMKLLGRAGAEMIPLLNMGGDAIDKLSVKMTTAFAEKADAYNDKLAGLSGRVGALGADLLIALLPALDAVTDAVTAGVGAFNSLPGPIRGLALGGATLAIAWGPITGIIGGLSAVAMPLLANGLANLALQTSLAGSKLPPLSAGLAILKGAILAIPGWGWALAGVAALTALGTALYLNNQDFKNWADNVVSIVANDFKGAMDDIVKGAQDAFKKAAEAGDWFGDRAKEIADSIPKGFADGFGRMVKAAQQKFAQMQAIVMGWWARIPAPVRGLLSKGASALSDSLNLVPGVYAARVAIQAMGKGPVTKKEESGNGNGNGGNGSSADLDALNAGGAGKKSKAASDKAETDRQKLEVDAARIALQAQYVKDERQINDLKRIGNLFQANGNTLKAFEVQKSEAILEAKLAEKKLTDETLIKLKESGNDKDKTNRKQRDTNILGEAAVKMAAEEEKLRSKLLDIDQQVTEERKKQARDQQKTLGDIRNRTKYAIIGATQGSEAESRQREMDDIQRRIDDAKANGNTDEANRLQKQLDALIAQFKQMDALANNAAFGFSKGIRGYLEGIGSLADSIAGVTKNVLQGLEDKLFEFVTTGKISFREFANDIIKQLIRIAIQQAILKPLLSGVGNLFGFAGGGGGAGIAGGQSIQYAANGMIAANGIKPFAMGGIVNSPTLFKFAKGGTMQNGLMGEAGPEAILPLQRGANGKLGVAGGGGSTTINVSVDAKGSSVEGDASQSRQLAVAISAAVQAEMVKQQRPGGLLSSTRR
jgi:lambda family phage tail tape measure protein